jgi:hypothetical protein
LAMKTKVILDQPDDSDDIKITPVTPSTSLPAQEQQ